MSLMNVFLTFVVSQNRKTVRGMHRKSSPDRETYKSKSARVQKALQSFNTGAARTRPQPINKAETHQTASCRRAHPRGHFRSTPCKCAHIRTHGDCRDSSRFTQLSPLTDYELCTHSHTHIHRRIYTRSSPRHDSSTFVYTINFSNQQRGSAATSQWLPFSLARRTLYHKLIKECQLQRKRHVAQQRRAACQLATAREWRGESCKNNTYTI